MLKSLVRELPPVHEIKEELKKKAVCSVIPEKRLTHLIQQEVDELRHALLNEIYYGIARTRNEFKQNIIEKVEIKALRPLKSNLRPVINATGVVLHTNLGRARLSDHAIERLSDVSRSYSTLEYNLSSGKRGSRHDIAEGLICEATGAEAKNGS